MVQFGQHHEFVAIKNALKQIMTRWPLISSSPSNPLSRVEDNTTKEEKERQEKRQLTRKNKI